MRLLAFIILVIVVLCVSAGADSRGWNWAVEWYRGKAPQEPTMIVPPPAPEPPPVVVVPPPEPPLVVAVPVPAPRPLLKKAKPKPKPKPRPKVKKPPMPLIDERPFQPLRSEK